MNEESFEYKVTLELRDAEYKIAVIDQRLEKCEQQQATIEKLVRSVDRLSMTIEGMTKEQANIKDEVSSLKSEPLENYKHYRRTIITSIITTIVGTIIGAILALILRG